MWRATPNPKCHVTFSKTKLNVNWHLHSIPKCHLNIWLTQYFRKLIFWMICNKKILSIERKYPSVSHVSPNVEDGRPIHCIHFKPTKRNPHKSIKGLQVQPIAQVAFDCILFGKSSLTNSYTWWNEYNFLPKLHKFKPICVPFHIATTYAPSLKYRYVLTLMSQCFHKFQEFSLTIEIFSNRRMNSREPKASFFI